MRPCVKKEALSDRTTVHPGRLSRGNAGLTLRGLRRDKARTPIVGRSDTLHCESTQDNYALAWLAHEWLSARHDRSTLALYRHLPHRSAQRLLRRMLAHIGGNRRLAEELRHRKKRGARADQAATKPLIGSHRAQPSPCHCIVWGSLPCTHRRNAARASRSVSTLRRAAAMGRKGAGRTISAS